MNFQTWAWYCASVLVIRFDVWRKVWSTYSDGSRANVSKGKVKVVRGKSESVNAKKMVKQINFNVNTKCNLFGSFPFTCSGPRIRSRGQWNGEFLIRRFELFHDSVSWMCHLFSFFFLCENQYKSQMLSAQWFRLPLSIENESESFFLCYAHTWWWFSLKGIDCHIFFSVVLMNVVLRMALHK